MDIVIVGFGNIGREVLKASLNSNINPVGIFSRDLDRARQNGAPRGLLREMPTTSSDLKGLADVAILCGGSKEDLPIQGPFWASGINTVDSFDTHDHVGVFIDEKTGLPNIGYFNQMDLIAKATGHTAMVCQGWDPGWFSLMRGLFQATLGQNIRPYAFYGLTETGGLSMGHSDAIRRIPGVVDARQFTHAIPSAIEAVRSGQNPVFKPGDMHWREGFVAIEPRADESIIRKKIVSMPSYFAPFRTEVFFLSQQELSDRFPDMPHDGLVIAKSDEGIMEFRLEWKSNPAGTARILLACARAACNFSRAGKHGAFSALSIAAADLFPPESNILSFV